MLKIAIIEDNNQYRTALAFILQLNEQLQLIHQLENCSAMISSFEKDKPDVVLMDIDMPGMNGIEGVWQIKKQFPEIKVLMLTVFEDDEKIFKSVMAGASGYLLKKTAPAKLLEALDDFVQGGAPMSGSIASRVLQMFRKQTHQTAARFNLSARELDILTGLTEGKSYRIIAAERFLSTETVRSHVKNIYEKLHVHSKAEAVAKAFREKLI